MGLLSQASRRLLGRMRLPVRARSTASRQGGHRSPVLNAGLEFADHRAYVAGDDIRRIDWKAFARHRQLSLRQFEEERDARVHILLDSSASMARGAPPKSEVAERIAGAIAFVASKQFDRAKVHPFALEPIKPSRPARNQQQYGEVEKFLLELTPQGQTAFDQAVRHLLNRQEGRGLCILVSDLMATEGWDAGLSTLASTGNDLLVVHVRAPEDWMPEVRGELELIDSERDLKFRVDVDSNLLEAYRKVVEEHLAGVRDRVRRSGGHLITVDVTESDEVWIKRLFGGLG